MTLLIGPASPDAHLGPCAQGWYLWRPGSARSRAIIRGPEGLPIPPGWEPWVGRRPTEGEAAAARLRLANLGYSIETAERAVDGLGENERLTLSQLAYRARGEGLFGGPDRYALSAPLALTEEQATQAGAMGLDSQARVVTVRLERDGRYVVSLGDSGRTETLSGSHAFSEDAERHGVAVCRTRAAAEIERIRAARGGDLSWGAICVPEEPPDPEVRYRRPSGGAQPGAGAPRKFVDPVRVGVQFERAQLAELDARIGGGDRSEAIRELITAWLREEAIAAFDAIADQVEASAAAMTVRPELLGPALDPGHRHARILREILAAAPPALRSDFERARRLTLLELARESLRRGRLAPELPPRVDGELHPTVAAVLRGLPDERELVEGLRRL